MSKSAPDKFFAPIVIAGITIGFLLQPINLFLPSQKPPQNQLKMLRKIIQKRIDQALKLC